MTFNNRANFISACPTIAVNGNTTRRAVAGDWIVAVTIGTYIK
jgi:hypothetical protein